MTFFNTTEDWRVSLAQSLIGGGTRGAKGVPCSAQRGGLALLDTKNIPRLSNALHEHHGKTFTGKFFIYSDCHAA